MRLFRCELSCSLSFHLHFSSLILPYKQKQNKKCFNCSNLNINISTKALLRWSYLSLKQMIQNLTSVIPLLSLFLHVLYMKGKKELFKECPPWLLLECWWQVGYLRCIKMRFWHDFKKRSIRMRWTLCQQRDEETDGFYTNSTNIKNTELKSLAVSLDETVRNGGAFNEHLSCDAECEKTNC